MKLKIFLLALLLSTLQTSFANKTIDPATAERVAKNAYFERSFQTSPIAFDAIKIIDRHVEMTGSQAALYIYEFANGGFVIVAGDDALSPIIGYALEGEFASKGSNPNFDSFMAGYTEQIAYIRENNIEPSTEVTGQWENYTSQDPQNLAIKNPVRGVSPLLINLWNQDNPYNMFAPEDPAGPGGRAYAGCVATAMSMIMHYWRYPLQGEGAHGYNCDYGYLYANFGETEYNYNHMQTEMDAEMPEIALLMYHCAVAVDMNFSASGSGASSWSVPGAIKNYFGYASTANYIDKSNYSNTGWVNILKDQIDFGKPMYYSGFSNSGGHAFVCDGYDDANLFHFNFGWSGSSNGFYALNDVGGYSSGQGAVINFIPGGEYPYTYTEQQLVTGKSGSIEDGSGPVANYVSDNQSSWLISPQSPNDSITYISLSFDRFDIATDDQVTVYDGATATANILGTFTGNENPGVLQSTGNELLVVFDSNGDNTATGFLAEYTCATPTWCVGMTMMNEPTGEITDGSFDFNYDSNSNCKWMVNPTTDGASTLYFTAFNTEPVNDKLLVYDLNGMVVLAELSGEYGPDNLPEPITSPSGKFFIAFITNNAINAQGFDAYYAPATVGIENDFSAQSDDLLIYPNPTKDMLNLKIGQALEGESQLSIFALSGVKVLNETISSGSGQNIKLNVSALKPGLYVVILRNGDDFYRRELAIY
jgi:hypothetical protein